MFTRLVVGLCTLSLLTPGLHARQKTTKEDERSWSDCLEDLSPYRKNYFLPLSFESDLSDRASSVSDGENEDTEAKFQLSLRYALTPPESFLDAQLFVAYTAQSYWQIYDVDHSSPFRTTDHEPEMFLEWRDLQWQNLEHLGLRVGLDHQSNGEGGVESRSWNRVYTELLWCADAQGLEPYERKRIPDSWRLDLRAWLPFNVADENDDIEDYLGYFELRGRWTLPFDEDRAHLLTGLVRNNLEAENRGAIELDYSCDLFNKTRLLLQYFAGYGESLLDYKENSHRFSVGFEFSP